MDEYNQDMAKSKRNGNVGRKLKQDWYQTSNNACSDGWNEKSRPRDMNTFDPKSRERELIAKEGVSFLSYRCIQLAHEISNLEIDKLEHSI